MLRKLSVDRGFTKDLKRQKKRNKNIKKIGTISLLLTRDGRLPPSYCPHKLSGEYNGLWECHVENDWLLIYEINDEEVIFVHTGTHSDLFE